jgi:hypothetical protein
VRRHVLILRVEVNLARPNPAQKGPAGPAG